MLAQALNEIKKWAKLPNNAAWSAISKVPTETIDKILCGATKDPRFSTVAQMVLSVGGSLDDLVKIAKIVVANEIKMQDDHPISLEMLTRVYEDQIGCLNAVVKALDQDRETMREEHSTEISRIKAQSDLVLSEVQEAHTLILKEKEAQIKKLQRSFLTVAVFSVALLIALAALISYIAYCVV
jgi:hypothetical protein